MTVLAIRTLGAPALRQKAAPVREIDGAVRRLVEDMFETMHAADGVGLAAPQVGVSRRVLVADVSGQELGGQRCALVNPEVKRASRKTGKEVEGCLSIPGIEESVERPLSVEVSALSPDGQEVRIEADGLLARVLQHEIDHLDGVLFIDRVSAFKRSMALKKWRKAQAGASAT